VVNRIMYSFILIFWHSTIYFIFNAVFIWVIDVQMLS